MFVVPTILVSSDPDKIRKGRIYNKVFVLLIPGRSASSPMPPIGTSGVELTCNTEPIGVTFRSILESKIEASEAASIGDTRQKELFYFQTSPSTSVDLFQGYFNKLFSFYTESNSMCLCRKTENAK